VNPESTWREFARSAVLSSHFLPCIVTCPVEEDRNQEEQSTIDCDQAELPRVELEARRAHCGLITKRHPGRTKGVNNMRCNEPEPEGKYDNLKTTVFMVSRET